MIIIKVFVFITLQDKICKKSTSMRSEEKQNLILTFCYKRHDNYASAFFSFILLCKEIFPSDLTQFHFNSSDVLHRVFFTASYAFEILKMMMSPEHICEKMESVHHRDVI